ncbi:3-hydroxyisobutyrate dehydrogenase [Xylogone sp. PMI_703]|nr:3-hydroxyisobutyrate dehydrogenase [Xylogone sp. PMI_703]
MSSSENTIAFIGLGVMGYSMAVNLRTKMDPAATLLVCDVNEAAIEKFQRQMSGKGPIEVVKNGKEAASRADMVITMLPGSKQVLDVYLDSETGILEGCKAPRPSTAAPKIVMECGTIETATIQHVGTAVTNSGLAHFVDAPVSGGPMGAEAGTLTFMVGCAPEDFDRAKAVLSYMGKKDSIFLCGGIGAGTAFKIINNYLSAITSIAASEALNIGTKMGLDVKLLTDVINVSGGQCWVTSHSNPVPGVQENVPSSRNYEGGFRIELCKKVLGMGVELADQVGARTVLSRPALAGFEECAADSRYAGKDARVVYKWINESK